MLRIENITKTFNAGTVNEKTAIENLSLHLKPGDFVTVIGSNGAGKSTLLNVIAGTYKVDQGQIFVDQQNITKLPEYKRAVFLGRVFQDPLAGTAPDMSIEENLAMAYARGQRRGLSIGVTSSRRNMFREQLKTLDQGLEDRLSAKVGLLSGGQRQALSLLMATFTQPKILLLDEHTAALDPKRAQLIIELTDKIVRRNSLTTLMITHNMEQALQLGNRLIMMHEGQIILDLSQNQKQNMTVKDLLFEFERVRGEKLVDDRVVLV